MDLVKEQKLRQLLKAHRNYFYSFPNVVNVMIGYAFKKGKLTDVPCIGVHVSRKKNVVEIPQNQILPRRLKGFKVDVLQTRPVKHSIDTNSGMQSALLTGGVYILNANLNQEGTLGSILFKDGKVYGISSNHVLFEGNGLFSRSGQREDPVDVGSGGQVGILTDNDPTVDVAVFSINSAVNYDANNSVMGIKGKINGLADVTAGAKVCKSGAATGVTYGIIAQYDDGKVYITPDEEKPGAPFISDEGDSGALWLAYENATLTVVGIHSGGEHRAATRHDPFIDSAYAYRLDDFITNGNYSF